MKLDHKLDHPVKDEFEWYAQMYCMLLICTIIPYF